MVVLYSNAKMGHFLHVIYSKSLAELFAYWRHLHGERNYFSFKIVYLEPIFHYWLPRGYFFLSIHSFKENILLIAQFHKMYNMKRISYNASAEGREK